MGQGEGEVGSSEETEFLIWILSELLQCRYQLEGMH